MKQLMSNPTISFLLFVFGHSTLGCGFLFSTTTSSTQCKYHYKVITTERCMGQQRQQKGQKQKPPNNDRNKDGNNQRSNNNNEKEESSSDDLSTTSTTNDNNTPLSMPLAGGPSLIFAMARRMLIWDDNDSDSGSATTTSSSSQESNQQQQQQKQQRSLTTNRVLPRWHPHPGISDINPTFRSTSPKMNSFGYLAAIRRNSRKRSPALQRYALRIYFDRFKDSGVPKSIVHYEGALVACSKLGLWQDALKILQDVDSITSTARGICVNDAMIMAFVKSCVRGSKRDKSLSIKEKRKSLEIARDFLNSIEEKYSIPLAPKYLIPIAAAYQKLKLYDESEILIRTSLTLIDNNNQRNNPNTNNKFSRIKKSVVNELDSASTSNSFKTASYSLLVKQSVENEDWENAVLNLKEMVDDGVYFPTTVEI